MGLQGAYNNCNYFFTYILFSALPRIVKYYVDDRFAMCFCWHLKSMMVTRVTFIVPPQCYGRELVKIGSITLGQRDLKGWGGVKYCMQFVTPHGDNQLPEHILSAHIFRWPPSVNNDTSMKCWNTSIFMYSIGGMFFYCCWQLYW